MPVPRREKPRRDNGPVLALCRARSQQSLNVLQQRTGQGRAPAILLASQGACVCACVDYVVLLGAGMSGGGSICASQTMIQGSRGAGTLEPKPTFVTD